MSFFKSKRTNEGTDLSVENMFEQLLGRNIPVGCKMFLMVLKSDRWLMAYTGTGAYAQNMCKRVLGLRILMNAQQRNWFWR